MKPGEIQSHHAIRGIAATCVVLLHLQDVLTWGGIHIHQYTKFLAKSYLWVDCFFILSGFIISKVYLQRFSAARGEEFVEQSRSFLLARLARVYPLHIFTLASVLSVRMAAEITRGGELEFTWDSNNIYTFITNALLIHSWGLHSTLTWNRPSWSISTEFFAYLFFPILAACLLRSANRGFFALLAISVAAYVCLGLLDGSLNQTFDLGLIRCLAGFMIGVSVFIAFDSLAPSRRTQLESLQLPSAIAIILGMHFGVSDFAIVIFFATLIFSTASDQGILAILLRRRTFVWIGVASYSIYMMHFPLIYLASEFKWFLFGRWIRDGSIDATALSIGIATGIGVSTLIVAALSYTYLEVPARRWIGGKHGRVRNLSS